MTPSPNTTTRLSIPEAQRNIINDFQCLENWDERYRYLIDLGRQLNRHSPVEENTQNRFYGCQSSVWLTIGHHDGVIQLQGHSDSLIVAGLMALLFHVYSERNAEDISTLAPAFLIQTGLIDNLSSQRATGIMHMIDHIRCTAAVIADNKGTI